MGPVLLIAVLSAAYLIISGEEQEFYSYVLSWVSNLLFSSFAFSSIIILLIQRTFVLKWFCVIEPWKIQVFSGGLFMSLWIDHLGLFLLLRWLGFSWLFSCGIWAIYAYTTQIIRNVCLSSFRLNWKGKFVHFWRFGQICSHFLEVLHNLHVFSNFS